jgi:DNA mismatch endonuclease, patch repair protein
MLVLFSTTPKRQGTPKKPVAARRRNTKSRASPSYRGFIPSSSRASQQKSKLGAKNTSPELKLRKILHALGARYTIHSSNIIGKPDVVFKSAKVAVFIDGDFWHGRNWSNRRRKLLAGANAAYWVNKIQANRSRDRFYSKLLVRSGWTVLRIWESDIHSNPIEIAVEILDVVGKRS